MPKKIFAVLAAILIFYTGNRCSEIYNSCTGNITEKIDTVSAGIDHIYSDIHISPAKNDLIFGAVCLLCFSLAVIYYVLGRRNFMTGIEHGSARWGTENDIKNLKDDNFQNNMLFTQTERMSLNTRKTFKNNNVLIVGGSGSGKTRFFLKPNLMQMHSSYVITDPKGTVILECGKMLAENGYKIRVLNTIDFKKSMHYNPFRYIRGEADILKLADMIIKNCGDKSEKQDFWVKAEKLLYQALFAYVYYELPEKEHNFSSVLTLLNAMEVKEEDENFVNAVDILFQELEEENPSHFAVLQYKKYKMAAGKTAKSILISCGVRLAPFDIEELRELTEYDDMFIEKIGEEKTALFIIIDDTSATFNFLASMLYTQLFNTLCNRADNVYNGRLPIHVRCLLDEFAVRS